MFHLLPIFIIFIIFYFYLVNADEHIGGYWVADDTAFTDKADIKSMMLYIGDKTKTSPFSWKTTRECYIVIAPNVANQGFSMKYSRAWNSNKNIYEIIPELTFDDDDDVLPSLAKWHFDIVKGILTITKDDVVYAKLYKQNELSDI